nr:uncharacterized protein LOC108175467 isoform X3 [Oryctolagus cuniculus]
MSKCTAFLQSITTELPLLCSQVFLRLGKRNVCSRSLLGEFFHGGASSSTKLWDSEPGSMSPDDPADPGLLQTMGRHTPGRISSFSSGKKPPRVPGLALLWAILSKVTALSLVPS